MLLVKVWICLMIMISQQEPSLKQVFIPFSAILEAVHFIPGNFLQNKSEPTQNDFYQK